MPRGDWLARDGHRRLRRLQRPGDPATQMFTYADGRRVHFFGVVFLASALQQIGTPDDEVLEVSFFSTDSLPAPLFVPDHPVLLDFVSRRQPPFIA